MTAVVTIFCFSFSYAATAEEKGCGKDYYSLLLKDDGEILSDVKADVTAYPASLTKLMTLYLTFEALEKGEISIEQNIKVSARGEEVSKVNKNNSLHLKEGDKITVRDAVKGVIVKSFNEASVSLAEAVSGDEWKFVRKMNEKAEELGMNRTSFRNSSGLHEVGQYTTAYDLARLTLALKNDFPGYYHLFSLKHFSYKGTKYVTHNHVLAEYKGAEGMKTGFTNASGFNLISIAKKHDVRVISVLLNCETYKKRDKFTKKLFDDIFAKFSRGFEPHGESRLLKRFRY
ncbi:MAG: D-alanyl-D-alanine carboxypeptidase [Rickettsiales bacterium]|nr:D-alanyl-D-alanine carboxypeptidase [Rickettsiales bacterium]